MRQPRITNRIRTSLLYIEQVAHWRHILTVEQIEEVVGWVLERRLMQEEILARIDDRVHTVKRIKTRNSKPEVQ